MRSATWKEALRFVLHGNHHLAQPPVSAQGKKRKARRPKVIRKCRGDSAPCCNIGQHPAVMCKHKAHPHSLCSQHTLICSGPAHPLLTHTHGTHAAALATKPSSRPPHRLRSDAAAASKARTPAVDQACDAQRQPATCLALLRPHQIAQQAAAAAAAASLAQLGGKVVAHELDLLLSLWGALLVVPAQAGRPGVQALSAWASRRRL